MSYTPPSSQPAPSRNRNVVPFVVGTCAVLAVCIACGAVAVGIFIFYPQRSVTTTAAPSVEYILDATQRMAQMADGENDTRLNVARGVLAEIVRPSDPAVTAGLRVFGSGAQPAACSDTALLVPLAPASQTQISTHLLSITNGVNPDAAMSQAMISAIRDLAALKGKHTLVVVTGGADSCTPQAGELIAAEAQKAGIDLKLFMVGYQVPDSDGNAIKGLVDSSGGNYINANSKEQLTEVIGSIQQYVQDQKVTTVTNVMGTAAAAVGTQNVIVAATQPTAGTTVPGNNATPAANGTPAPGSTSVATQGGIAPGNTGQTACDNPYFPMRPGSTWTFSTDNGQTTWTVSGVTGDQTEATAAMDFSSGTVSGTYNWHCTGEGLVSYEFGGLAGTGGSANIKVTQHSGTWLPPADKLVPGATWDNSYTLEATDTTGGTAETITETFNEHYTLVGTEQHDVAGKTMEALHIDGTGSIKFTASTGSGSYDYTSTYLLVRGVGPVLLSSQFGTTKSSSTLTSYSIP